MTNLTITVDDEVLRRARIRALEEGSSVNAVLRDYLARKRERQSRAGRGPGKRGRRCSARCAGSVCCADK